MTPNLKLLAAAISRTAPDSPFEFDDSDPPSIVVRARSKDVGDLVVYDDCEEFTVCIGELHHTHFSAYNYEQSQLDERMAEAAHDAACYVAAILADRVRITVRYKGDQCVGSSAEAASDDVLGSGSISYPMSAWWFRATRAESFLWSGPVA